MISGFGRIYFRFHEENIVKTRRFSAWQRVKWVADVVLPESSRDSKDFVFVR